MNSTAITGNTTYPSALRVLYLARFFYKENPSLEEALDRLVESNVGISKRQLERDLQLVKRLFGATARVEEDGRKFWKIVHPCGWRRFLSPRPADRGAAEVPELLAAHENDDPITFEHDSLEISRRASILIRLMLIVEMLPEDDETQGMTVSCIQGRLAEFGLYVSNRTIQRDLRFIHHHFLILVQAEGAPGARWARCEGHSWLDVFEPRLPELKSDADDVVNRFLYGPSTGGRKSQLHSIH